jgi:hypothetical protein
MMAEFQSIRFGRNPVAWYSCQNCWKPWISVHKTDILQNQRTDGHRPTYISREYGFECDTLVLWNPKHSSTNNSYKWVVHFKFSLLFWTIRASFREGNQRFVLIRCNHDGLYAEWFALCFELKGEATNVLTSQRHQSIGEWPKHSTLNSRDTNAAGGTYKQKIRSAFSNHCVKTSSWSGTWRGLSQLNFSTQPISVI